ncbi:MAG: DUF805 domain-containing protein [Asticcacaulis sp.]|uniref:DUF805 domain-containing protein n=1 Tax=Asticcacaulis sp. TaxID=1872648 RepID=UPI003F7C2CA6
MSFVEAIKSGFKNYVNFQGRATRSEYWWWVLFEILLTCVPGALIGLGGESDALASIGGLLYIVIGLGLLLPSLSVYIRRLHDTDHSGWWLLLGFIPLIGGIVLLVWTIMKGTSGPNKYGPDPLAPSVASVF